MSFRAKFDKVSSRTKALFTPKRTSRPASPAGQPTVPAGSNVSQTNAAPPHSHQAPLDPAPTVDGPQSLASDAHNPISATESPQPAAVVSSAEEPSDPAITVPAADSQALVADEENESRLSQGFAVFKSALKFTKEVGELFTPVKVAAGTLLITMEGFETVKEMHKEFTYAGRKVQAMRSAYEQHRPQLEASKSTKDSMDSLARAMQIVERMVQAKLDRGYLRRILESPSDVKAVADALRMLGDVANQFTMSVTVSTYSMVMEGNQDRILDHLNFVQSAQFLALEDGRLCAEGTRAEFLADLLAWAMAADQPCICWLNGPAGSGKTTIAYTVCNFLRDLGLLGGSFFCSRDADVERRSTKFIFSTLARSLAYHDTAYARSLVKVLKEPGAGGVKTTEQLMSLIVRPLQSARSSGNAYAAPIRILVIDALDECADDGKKTIYDIIRRLVTETRGLPLKFLITSRPETQISQAFNNAAQGAHLVRGVQNIPEGVAEIDIRIYLEGELTEYGKEYGKSYPIGNDWPPESQVQALAKRAGTLFIYASTACKYICSFDEDPVKRLSALIAAHAEPLRGIDPMYEFVLGQVRRSKDLDTWATTRRCIQAIVRLSHPLSVGDLGDLLDIDRREVHTAIAGLQSVLRIPSSDDTNTITVFHASFPDYLLDESRSRGKDWFLENSAVHRDLLQRCITVMKLDLRFNISKCRTSYRSNEEQPDKPVLSGALRYSCLHWIDHLEGCGTPTVSEVAELSELLTGQFLYWLEVLSIQGEVQRATIAMSRLLYWLHAYVPLTDESLQSNAATLFQNFRQFTRDARDFVHRFSRPIRESCPHIYLSALAATTLPSVRTAWLPMFKGLPSILTEQPQSTGPLLVLHGHKDNIYCLAFSPDGTRVVSGSSDCTIRLWNAATGAAIGDPLRGHDDWIRSVAFSPDGTRFVSGSYDRTIRVWNAATGAPIGDPLRGHEGRIHSVAFSPDGTCVVSGSYDGMIRLWDAITGVPVGDPLRGHEDWINSVAFSPDGTHVVSGSYDRTIRLWDASTRVAIGNQLCRQNTVMSVAFSSDGTRVVSGSYDGSIRLWELGTGAAISGPYRGHEGRIHCVAFSPDNTHVVSGSSDGTIRLWDSNAGAFIGEPLRGHEGTVDSVAFSPDGLHIVSGSSNGTILLWDAAMGAAIDGSLRGHWDTVTGRALHEHVYGDELREWLVTLSSDERRLVMASKDGDTIRLWDVATGAPIGDPIRGHERGIHPVAFSPDGARVVSGSDDRTIRPWDAAAGAAIGDPIRSHESWVLSVAFSKDGACFISGSQHHTIRLWDAAAGAAIADPLRGHKEWARSVVVSPDGMRVVSSSDVCTFRLWDAATGAAIGDPVRGLEDWVKSVAFSPDGTHVVCTYSDGTTYRWDTESDSAISSVHCLARTTRAASTARLHTTAFSPVKVHATDVGALFASQRDCRPQDAFSLGDDGWLKGPNGELFLWILPEYRRGLWWPGIQNIRSTHPVMLDLSRFRHGEDWTKCFQEDDHAQGSVQ